MGKPQRPQRNTLSTLKEYPFKEITEKIITCAFRNSFCSVLDYLRTEDIRVGLVINFSVERIKDEIKRVILVEITEGEKRINSFKSINIKYLLCVLPAP